MSCVSGEVVWGRFAPAEARVEGRGGAAGRLGRCRSRFRVASDLAWLLARSDGRLQLSERAQQLLRGARARAGRPSGASWSRASKVRATELEPALWELIAAGEVTSDGFAGLRAFIERARPTAGSSRDRSARSGWTLVAAAPRLTTLPTPRSRSRSARGSSCARYGVVFRDLLAREAGCPPWREPAARVPPARGARRAARRALRLGLLGRAVRAARRGGDAARGAAHRHAPAPRCSRSRPPTRSTWWASSRPGARVPATVQRDVTYIDGVPRLDAGAIEAEAVG